MKNNSHGGLGARKFVKAATTGVVRAAGKPGHAITAVRKHVLPNVATGGRHFR